MSWAVDFIIIAILVVGIRLFRTPKGARAGNLLAAVALALALLLVVVRHPIVSPALVLGALLVGSAVGLYVAMKVSMIQIPAMVAFQHGAGGVAAFLVSYLELTRHAETLTTTGTVSGYLGLVIGSATFSGSMIASGRLSGLMRGTPTFLPFHSPLLLANALLVAVLAFVAGGASPALTGTLLIVLVTLSALMGVVFAIRIGGADMPVLISFLNATAGLAAAFCGIVIENRLLIAGGATVAASGSILTYVMLKAMNRSLATVFVGIKMAPAGTGAAKVAGGSTVVVGLRAQSGPASTGEGSRQEVEDPFSEAVRRLSEARSVILIPGFGMALAQAQFALVQLADRLSAAGKEVRYAIHPLAGRMPGHMHVLLAEAQVPSSSLFDIKEINDDFSKTDVTLVVGACDVVNPAAIHKEGTPISGMPILMAHESGRVIVCNLDEKPGYSGVENPLYSDGQAILLFGDAKASLEKLLGEIDGGGSGPGPAT